MTQFSSSLLDTMGTALGTSMVGQLASFEGLTIGQKVLKTFKTHQHTYPNIEQK